MKVSTVGLDLAKNVFQVHGVDGLGKSVIRRQLRRGQVLPFSRGSRHVWWGLKPVPHRTIGRARSQRCATRFG